MVGSMLQAPWALGYALLALIAYLTKSWKTIQVLKYGVNFEINIFHSGYCGRTSLHVNHIYLFNSGISSMADGSE